MATMEQQWIFHQLEIRQLYIHEDRSLKDIMSQLEKAYGFAPTHVSPHAAHGLAGSNKRVYRKAQYEANFGEWERKKNLPPDSWRYVGHQIEKRRREGRETDIIYSSVRL